MKPDLQQSGSWIGMSGMAVAFFLYGYSAFAVHDIVTIVVLPLVWLVLFVLAARWFMTRPYRVLLLPVGAVVVWFVVMLSR